MKLLEARKKLIALAVSAVLSIGSVHAQVIDKATIAAAGRTGIDTVALIQKAAMAERPNMQYDKAVAVQTFDINARTMAGPAARYRPISSIPDKHEREVCEDAAQLIMNDHVLSGAALLSAAELARGDAGSETLHLLSEIAGGMMPRISDQDAARGLFQDNRAQHDRTNAARERLRGIRPELQLFAQLRVFGVIWNDTVAISAGQEGLARAGLTPAEQQVIAYASQAAGPSKVASWVAPAMERALATSTLPGSPVGGVELPRAGKDQEI